MSQKTATEQADRVVGLVEPRSRVRRVRTQDHMEGSSPRWLAPAWHSAKMFWIMWWLVLFCVRFSDILVMSATVLTEFAGGNMKGGKDGSKHDAKIGIPAL